MILTRKYEKDLQLNWPLKYDTVFTNWSSLKSLNCSCLKIDLCLFWRWLPLACAWYKSQFSRYYFVWALSVVNLRHTYFIHFNTVKSSLNCYNSIKNKFTHKYPSNRCPTVAIKCRYDDRCECRHNTIETKTWKKNSGFKRDSNPRPLRYRCNALPSELSNPFTYTVLQDFRVVAWLTVVIRLANFPLKRPRESNFRK